MSPLWFLIASLAYLGVYTDTRPTTGRRMVLAVCLALLAGAGLYAATVSIVIIDPCSVPPLSELPWWEQLLLGCW